MSERDTSPNRHPPAAGALLFSLLAIFVGGGLWSGWIFLSTIGALVDGQPSAPRPPIIGVGSLPIIPAPAIRPGPGAARSGPPTAVASAPTPIAEEPLPIWDGKDRVTILLLGIDQRDDEHDTPTRSDTMILLTMDPVNLTAGLLSLPRDLWVPIPGHGENKLNTAHFFGEMTKPGQGPSAARRAIQYNIGVPINYYARVDFRGFERLIDAIGGVTIDVDRAILDDEYPNENYGITRLFVPAGPQRMNGITALRYARSRHADSDFGRIRRQQRVIQAAREEALDLNLVTVSHLPQMIGILMSSISTDVPLRDLPALANLGRQIPTTSITSRQIDDSMIIDVNRDGTVLLPDREKIRTLVQELFYSPAVRQDAARVELLNGTARDGLASSLRTVLQPQGFNIVRIDTAEKQTYATSVITVRNGKDATAAKLASLLNIPSRAIRSEAGAGRDADVTVILGSDVRSVQ